MCNLGLNFGGQGVGPCTPWICHCLNKQAHSIFFYHGVKYNMADVIIEIKLMFSF